MWNASHLGLFLFAFSDNLISEDWFFEKASGFYPFDDATALAGEGGVGDVAWLIQASASNHKPKGRFFYVVNQGILVI